MGLSRIEFDVTHEDRIAANRVMIAQDGAIRKTVAQMRRGSLILIGTGLLAGGGVAYFQPPPIWVGLEIGLFLVTIDIAAWPTRRLMKKKADVHAKNANSDPAYRMALGWRAVELRPEYMILEAGYGRSEIAWRVVIRTHLDDDYLILTLPGPQLVTIPRVAFRLDSEFDQFVTEAYRLIEAGGGNVGDSPPDDPDGAVAE